MSCLCALCLQIGWPASLTTVFKFASFTTVNVDSASPECSVKGLGYHQKWFFTQLLPLCFAGLLVMVYVIKFTVAWVKWKMTPPQRRKPLKGKGYMTLVNVYLGALNLMYIFLIQKALEVHRVRVRMHRAWLWVGSLLASPASCPWRCSALEQVLDCAACRVLWNVLALLYSAIAYP